MTLLKDKTPSGLLLLIKSDKIDHITFRFVDFSGRWHSIGSIASTVNEDTLVDGIMFDASSIPGWQDIDAADMILRPDLSAVFKDPFAERPTLIILCTAVSPKTMEGYHKDPRSIAQKSIAYLKSTGFADDMIIGAEPEFFIFDRVHMENSPLHSSFSVHSVEIGNTDGQGKSSLTPLKGGYWSSMPFDKDHDLRSEMLLNINKMGARADKHHHEVASAQHELCLLPASMVMGADFAMIYKYCVRVTAELYGKSATFMPKPILGDNGSGMHVHQSLWKDGKPVFAGNEYAGLSELALYYIGGVLKHAKALNALTNPSTNSYKRLVPGYEAPILLAYSAANRSASFRIPHSSSEKSRRIEARFPDASCNPYLACAGMLMAGIDGIKNKIHPGKARDGNLYALPPKELKSIPAVCSSLEEAIDALEKDHGFLLEGGVFTTDMLQSYITLKRQELKRVATTPTPVEYGLYYDI